MDDFTLGGAADRVSIAALQQKVREQADLIDTLQLDADGLHRALSHDLRAPLRAIAGFSALLREDAGGQLPAEWDRYLRHIHTAGCRMSEQIEALLKLSEVSRCKVAFETVDLSAIAREIHIRFALRDPTHPVAVHVGEGLTVSGDAGMLRLLLEALLDNAWRFTAGVAEPRIEFDMQRRDDGACEYQVRDNGIGFDMTDVEQLFVPFRRLQASREAAGCGIGLALARRIVHRHHGRLRAEALSGGGAMFAFTLAPG